jgi:hypothetical protein
MELGRNLVDAGFGAGFVLVAARGAGNADGADSVVADHDRQRALGRHEIGEEELPRIGVALDGVGEFARRRARGAGGIGLLHRVFEGRKAGGGIAYRHDHLAFAAEHIGGHVVTLRFAGLDGRHRDGRRGGNRQVFMSQKLGVGGDGNAKNDRKRDAGNRIGWFEHGGSSW